ncbi:MAG: membrane protein insertion efficiency factor YidD [bacterium]
MLEKISKKLIYLAEAVILAAIRFYQLSLSPDQGFFKRELLVCRFHPSCSDYALQGIKKFGILKGGLLAARRVLRCHPFNPGGLDPVPEKRER